MTEKFENNPIMVLVLAIVTCGLYLIYWNVKMSQVLNQIAGKEVISQPIAIIAGFCAPLNGYFYYLTGSEVMPKVYAANNESDKDQSTLLLILGIVFPMVAAMIVQGEINKYYTSTQK